LLLFFPFIQAFSISIPFNFCSVLFNQLRPFFSRSCFSASPNHFPQSLPIFNNF
jgi:hypothetical protein